MYISIYIRMSDEPVTRVKIPQFVDISRRNKVASDMDATCIDCVLCFTLNGCRGGDTCEFHGLLVLFGMIIFGGARPGPLTTPVRVVLGVVVGTVGTVVLLRLNRVYRDRNRF